jgi:ABC-type nitrate/sulfonate/bicarbonate transport system ATPase subunit
VRPRTRVAASSVPQATFDYLASLKWIRAAENVCLVGPAGTGKSHLLIALGLAAVGRLVDSADPFRASVGRRRRGYVPPC